VAQDGDYFDALDELCCNGNGIPALLFHLLNTSKYDHVDLRKPPATKALDDQKQQSLDSTECFWMDVLERGYIISPLKNGEDSAMVSQINADNVTDSVHGISSFQWEEGLYLRMSFIYSEYLLFCREKKENYPVSNRSFWNKTKRKDSPQSIFRSGMVVMNKNNAKCILIVAIDVYKEEFSESVCRLTSSEKTDENNGLVPFNDQF
jgi:hypothetical protein